MRLTTFYRMPVFFRTGFIFMLFAGIWGAMPAHAEPSAFSLLLPANEAAVSTSVLLDWEDSTDPAGLTYTIYLSKGNDSFEDEDTIKIKDISDSNRLLKKETDDIQDSTTYYWKVWAVSNSSGKTSVTEVWQFTTDDTNAVPAWIGGYVKDANNRPIVNAKIKVRVWNSPFDFTTDSKGYFLGELKPAGQINPGTEEEITVDVAAEGYQAISSFATEVTVGDVVMLAQDFILQTAPIPGDVNGDREVNLKDAVLVLKILTGESPSGIQKESALNQDQKIGLPELIYILRRILNSN
ncbi:MAG: hypothetical protein BWK80_63205 [Desulfobacteraceae bacterium IS3]|nr:MAG: hypothetical protein BWK80_63205 [Desulfobacteraceae bacterium IS3]